MGVLTSNNIDINLIINSQGSLLNFSVSKLLFKIYSNVFHFIVLFTLRFLPWRHVTRMYDLQFYKYVTKWCFSHFSWLSTTNTIKHSFLIYFSSIHSSLHIKRDKKNINEQHLDMQVWFQRTTTTKCQNTLYNKFSSCTMVWLLIMSIIIIILTKILK